MLVLFASLRYIGAYGSRRQKIRSQDVGRDPTDGGGTRAGGRGPRRGDRLVWLLPHDNSQVAAKGEARWTWRSAPLNQGDRAPRQMDSEAKAAGVPLEQRQASSPVWF